MNLVEQGTNKNNIAKQKASYMAIEEQMNSHTKVVGIGSGSTIVYAVQRLGQLYKQKKVSIQACIPSSFQAQQLILEHGLPLANLVQYPGMNICNV
jgi:ribose 5-phosphate isomerase A